MNLQRIWWREKDSNLRRRTPSDLQSDPFGRLGIPPHKASSEMLNTLLLPKKFIIARLSHNNKKDSFRHRLTNPSSTFFHDYAARYTVY